MLTITRAPPASVPAVAAATGRTQLRGSRSAWRSPSESSSAQLESSAAACSVMAVKVLSTRETRSSGGSIGRSASLSSSSSRMDPASFTVSSPRSILHLLLELLDGTVQQDLGRAVASAQRPRDLAIRHPKCEPHDQRLAAVLREPLQPVHDQPQLLAPSDDALGVVRMRGRLDRVQPGLRATCPVAVVVGGEVVCDPDQPRSQRPAVRLATRALEVPVGLQEGLLGEVLGVVVVADAVVRVRVDVA